MIMKEKREQTTCKIWNFMLDKGIRE